MYVISSSKDSREPPNDVIDSYILVDFCFTFMSYDGIYYLNNGWGSLLSLLELITYDNSCIINIKYIMYNVQVYSILRLYYLYLRE
jgi:hypothetical protein